MTATHRPTDGDPGADGPPPAGGREGADLLRLITDSVPGLVSYVDSDFRYRLANRAYQEWFGEPADRIVGRHVREVLGEAAWGAVRPHLERALTGEPVGYEDDLPYQSGGTRS